jgi:hypothetical protein
MRTKLSFHKNLSRLGDKTIHCPSEQLKDQDAECLPAIDAPEFYNVFPIYK